MLYRDVVVPQSPQELRDLSEVIKAMPSATVICDPTSLYIENLHKIAHPNVEGDDNTESLQNDGANDAIAYDAGE
jgi:hypothetical protein